jgi:hypothetical protein
MAAALGLLRFGLEWRAGARLLLLVAALVAGGLAASGAPGPTSGERGVQPAAQRAKLGFQALPQAARAPVAQALGRHDRAYHVRRASSGLLAATSGPHGLEASFTSAGVRVRSGPARLGLSLRTFGYGDARRGVVGAQPRASANRVSYRRGALTEWYANGPLGLEQGFTLRSRPAPPRTGPLTLELALSGNLSASLERSRDGVRLRGSGASLRYTGLLASDARGRELPAWLELRGRRLLVRVDDTRARYPISIDPFVQQAKLIASDGTGGDGLGVSVAVSGDTVVVGAPRDDVGANADQGSAYVFQKPAAGWSSATETAKLTASDGAAGDRLGVSVAVSGGTVAVGASQDTEGANPAPGAAYVFQKPAAGWASATETAKLTASDGAAADQLGRSVAVSGDTVVTGAPHEVGPNFTPGAAYVFQKPAAGWASATETAKLTASDGAIGDGLGDSVAVSGDTVVAGAVGVNPAPGAAYVFQKPAAGWASATETAKLTASDGAIGDVLGDSVAVSGDTVAAGAPGDDVGANQSQGSAYVFVKPATGWASATETAKLTASDGAAFDGLGGSVAVSGDTVVAGAPGDDVGANPNQGSAYVFQPTSKGWAIPTEAKLTASDGAAFDGLGASVAVSGDTVVAGAPLDESAYVFVAQDSTPPDVTINQAAGQADPTSASPINFTAVFTEPVSGFQTGDVTLGGTAGATTAGVSEIAPMDGTTYNVAVSGMTTSGTVIASIPAGVATDAAGNANTASTSTDNTVTFVAAPTCNGQTATIYVGADGRIVGGPGNGQLYAGKLNGTSGADVIVGTAGMDDIDAKAGGDTICARGGNDVLEAAGGNDRLFGEEGNDRLKGGGGNDTMTGGPGADKFRGGEGTDTATDFNAAEGDTKIGVEVF